MVMMTWLVWDGSIWSGKGLGVAFRCSVGSVGLDLSVHYAFEMTHYDSLCLFWVYLVL